MGTSQEEVEMSLSSAALLEESSNLASDGTPDGEERPVTPHDATPGFDEPDGSRGVKSDAVNEFGVRRTTVQCMLDLALVAANFSQLRVILSVGPSRLEFYSLVLWSVSLSLFFQFVFAVIIIAIKIREDRINPVSRDPEVQPVSTRPTRDGVLDILNYVSMALVLIVTLLNMFIGGFVNVKNTSHVNDSVEIPSMS
ncbi:ninjurin-1-like [Haliotis rufescens]|uniref:ninjurin-1-like n=1 Tax=Haliotis rufescens TaxID=6454 RepID=UPI001EAFE740|nr:ninjurin-1-like [Haliotis rufescens]